jgi:hypothetical protein
MDSDRDYGGRRAPLAGADGPRRPGPADSVYPVGPADSAERDAVRRGGGVTVTVTTWPVNSKTLSSGFAMSGPAATTEAMAAAPGRPQPLRCG